MVGTCVGQLVILFVDGTGAHVPLILGHDLMDWSILGDISKVAHVSVAWVGGRPVRALYHKTWTNPTPEKTITSFDFVSTLRQAAPNLVAATAE